MEIEAASEAVIWRCALPGGLREYRFQPSAYAKELKRARGEWEYMLTNAKSELWNARRLKGLHQEKVLYHY